eukprot:g665.t1
MSEEGTSRYPKRARRQRSLSTGPASSVAGAPAGFGSGAAGSSGQLACATPTGRVLVVHANNKEYGQGARGSKQSNRNDFAFSAADYVAMRDTGRPYPAARNPLLPLPRPTYTEFVNRARRARMLDRLDFLYVAPDAAHPPRTQQVNYRAYERVVWAGISFRRFARLWTPERNQFFRPEFRRRVKIVLLLCARQRAATCTATGAPRGAAAAAATTASGCCLGSLPDECLHSIIAFAAAPSDSIIDGYDSIETIRSGALHVFLPAPGSSGMREALFDEVFGLGGRG